MSNAIINKLRDEVQSLRNRISEMEEEHQEIHNQVVEACYDALEDAGIAEQPDGGGQPDYILPAIVAKTLLLLAENGNDTLLESSGVLAIAQERHRQKTTEGWTPEHDDEHNDGSMAIAACCYAEMSACMALDHARAVHEYGPGHQHWPWDRRWWKPSTARRNLEKAGALVAAEIDRLDRAQARASNLAGQSAREAGSTAPALLGREDQP